MSPPSQSNVIFRWAHMNWCSGDARDVVDCMSFRSVARYGYCSQLGLFKRETICHGLHCKKIPIWSLRARISSQIWALVCPSLVSNLSFNGYHDMDVVGHAFSVAWLSFLNVAINCVIYRAHPCRAAPRQAVPWEATPRQVVWWVLRVPMGVVGPAPLATIRLHTSSLLTPTHQLDRSLPPTTNPRGITWKRKIYIQVCMFIVRALFRDLIVMLLVLAVAYYRHLLLIIVMLFVEIWVFILWNLRK